MPKRGKFITKNKRSLLCKRFQFLKIYFWTGFYMMVRFSLDLSVYLIALAQPKRDGKPITEPGTCLAKDRTC
jgi:hypothetical protein